MNIEQLTLYTANLRGQVDFYNTVLNLAPIDKSRFNAVYKIGNTLLNFVAYPTGGRYHFAINIPANKAEEALAWLKPRVAVLKDGSTELINFKNWNAHSMYFYDANHNIVELIARKSLKTGTMEPFSEKQFISISEIGIGTKNISAVYQTLNNIKPLPVYWGSMDTFCAAGDEHGLFIISDRNKKKWYPTNDDVTPADFVMRGDYNIKYNSGKISRITTS